MINDPQQRSKRRMFCLRIYLICMENQDFDHGKLWNMRLKMTLDKTRNRYGADLWETNDAIPMPRSFCKHVGNDIKASSPRLGLVVPHWWSSCLDFSQGKESDLSTSCFTYKETDHVFRLPSHVFRLPCSPKSYCPFFPTDQFLPFCYITHASTTTHHWVAS